MNLCRATLAPIAALVFLCVALPLARAQKPLAPRPIQIENGKLLGVLTPDQQVIAYKGIPYAQPPLEELRWRPPMPVGKWKHVLFAQDFGPHCLQSGTWPDMTFHDSGPSEDCLTLNVWAPANAHPDKKSPRLPVMVWIYGGGFGSGGTSESRQDGQYLAHRGVIVVSMNYRLGIFGFFAHPELTAESPNHTSGNYGLLDQAAALAWVKRNIAAFGGDPANVTLFGESAGSESVSEQMASPLTAGLFAKAIGESGAGFPDNEPAFPTRERAEQINAAWAERAFGSSRMFFLRQLPADEILKAATSTKAGTPHFSPILDGVFLPDTLPHIFADAKQAHIPVLAGWNATEDHPDRIPTEQASTAQGFTAQAQAQFGAAAPQFLSLYPASTDADAARSADDYSGDLFTAFDTWAWLEAHTRTGNAPVYRYFFDLPSPGDRYHKLSDGAFHSDDIEYVFGTLDSRAGMTVRPEDRALSDQMQQYWTNFARTGDPNGPNLPKWPVYNATGSYPVMHLDRSPTAQPDALRPRYLFLDSIWGSTGTSPK
ncbi:MAG TPA: carboxylesterase family protein [Acidobacteriaceae bacterium]|jgi:para-nitrobenzyl esterase